jgi:hypothetical protein
MGAAVPTTSDPLLSPDDEQVSAWVNSGAFELTGRSGQPPLGPPRGLVPKLAAVAGAIEGTSSNLGRAVAVDPLALLSERATMAGLDRRSPISCGGATHLLPTGADWMALSLARSDDVDLLGAWLERPVGGDAWSDVAAAVAALDRDALDALIDRAVLLGLPAAIVGERSPTDPPWRGLPVAVTSHRGEPVDITPLTDVRVVDLSSLWAGPLCGAILAQAGAQVIKVESTRRPDGARAGSAPFFDRLNGTKTPRSVDLSSTDGVAALARLIGEADVVIESSRPRALQQLGIDAHAVMATGAPRVWLSITGHGRRSRNGQRVAFGDDAAVAGGLVCWDDDGPCFCADAVADPASGLVAAAAVLEALSGPDRVVIDVAMAGVAAHLAGPTIPLPDQPLPKGSTRAGLGFPA